MWCYWPDYAPFLKPWWSPEILSGWCGRSWSMWLRPPCSRDTGRPLCRRLRVLCRGVKREKEKNEDAEDWREHTVFSPNSTLWTSYSYPFPHLTLGLSDRNMGRNRMKSSPTGRSFPLGVMGRQCTQDEFTTRKRHRKHARGLVEEDWTNTQEHTFTLLIIWIA